MRTDIDLEQELEDDSTPYGGISFRGETLSNFLLETNMSLNAPIEDINAALIQCGIIPIKRIGE